jgi:signal transduction histidine kinase
MVKRTFRSVIENKKAESFELQGPGARGLLTWYSTNVSPIFADGKVVGLTLLTMDITERKHAEAEQARLIVELESKNAELTRFVYTVSHDLKSPLVTINGYLGYIEEDARSGNLERLQQDTRRIQAATDKMHALLTELLELSRIGRVMNAAEDVPFADIAQDALDIVHGQLESRRVSVHTQPNLPTVHGDRQRLMEVLQNLLDNAAKYMGDQPNPQIEIGYSGEENGKAVLYVKDNGIGVAPEYHERIFGLFNKLDADSEGTGVGLALVKRIIEIHAGRIWIESAVGQGSTFYFSLPMR